MTREPGDLPALSPIRPSGVSRWSRKILPNVVTTRFVPDDRDPSRSSAFRRRGGFLKVLRRRRPCEVGRRMMSGNLGPIGRDPQSFDIPEGCFGRSPATLCFCARPVIRRINPSEHRRFPTGNKREHQERARPCAFAGAAPATVCGETDAMTSLGQPGKLGQPGRRRPDDDPRARRPAAESGQSRTHRPGVSRGRISAPIGAEGGKGAC